MTQENSIQTAKELVITRVFDAPRALVFKAFTEAEHLVHWWGPTGFQLSVHKLDVRPGGVFHYSMKSADGFEMWGIFVYHEIKAPEKLIFINSFSDEQGNITRAAFSPTWPLEILNTWIFTEEHGKTTITLRGKPHNATKEEHDTFEGGFASMNQGFGGTFDQLDAYLATL